MGGIMLHTARDTRASTAHVESKQSGRAGNVEMHSVPFIEEINHVH